MKKLVLIRHAKAEDPTLNPDDFNRRLTDRGKANAQSLGSWLSDKVHGNPLIISSPAKRTRSTAKRIAQALGIAPDEIVYKDTIYLSPLSNLNYLLQETPENRTAIIMVGHNPGMSELLDYLSDKPEEPFRTCGCAILDLHVPRWALAARSCAKVIARETPR
jgi:phosphohistidine phosphatase